MRLAILIATCGVLVGAPILAPASLLNKAQASAISSLQDQGQMSEEQYIGAITALYTEITALLAAGNAEGIDAVLAAQVRAGNFELITRVAQELTTAAVMAGPEDPDRAIALARAAVTLVTDPAVANSYVGRMRQDGVLNEVSGIASYIPGGQALTDYIRDQRTLLANLETQQQQTPPPVQNNNNNIPVATEPNPSQSASPT